MLFRSPHPHPHPHPHAPRAPPRPQKKQKKVLILLADLATKLTNYTATGSLQGAAPGSSAAPAGAAGNADVPEPLQRQLASMLETLLSSCAPQPHSLAAPRSSGNSNAGNGGAGKGNNSDAHELWTAIMTSEHLPKILDVFRGNKKVSLCRDLLELFRHHPPTGDAVLINALFDIGRPVHDAVDSLTPDGDRKHTGQLLCSFVQKIDCGRNLEQQLNLYVECRARFRNLDMVKERLILCVTSLCARAHRLMKGKHNKKTAAFVKAALAYCHITVPSIADPFKKLHLLRHCAEVALMNQCLPQTDTFLKAAIHLLTDLPASDEADAERGSDGSSASASASSASTAAGGGVVRKGTHTEERVAAHLRALLSLLVVVPGHPKLGPFYILNGLVNALPRYPWLPTTGVQTRLYIDLLALLCALSQRRLPYHVASVDSNDELFGGGQEYTAELGELLATVMTEILRQLNVLGAQAPADAAAAGMSAASAAALAAAAKGSQVRCVLQLVNQLGARFEFSSPVVVEFVLKLLDLVQQCAAAGSGSAGGARAVGLTKADHKHFHNTLAFLKGRATNAAAVKPEGAAGNAVAPSFLPKVSALLAAQSQQQQ